MSWSQCLQGEHEDCDGTTDSRARFSRASDWLCPCGCHQPMPGRGQLSIDDVRQASQ